MNRFVELAGGADARIVVIPTAGEQEDFSDDWSGLRPLRAAGARRITVLHTRDAREADTEKFVAPLRKATGVWIPGGRQWRLADVYLNTRTLRELFGVLRRGGVIGGSSAGASIQASFMVRGAPEGNQIMMAKGHEQGFGLLSNAAVDQHLLTRNRHTDLLEVTAAHPELLGIGIDEGTAIVVHGERAEVIGRSLVAFYNTGDAEGRPYYFLRSGDVFDLGARRVLQGTPLPPQTADERAVIATVQRLFDAMRAADSAAVRRLFHPEAKLFVPDTRDGRPTVTVSTLDSFVRAIGASNQRLDERFYQPEVRLDANLATVWTPYDFYRGSEFSHCGIDAFHLARTTSGWTILQIAYTRRTEGCTRTSR
ncbi:MAG: Type 1 glutamine amidotransferase-like domain-containing protein [Gemmatimonadetes bacterium]|nr:Type 1 glutamine amidotransferase-like domain-containing protein [Gemmatimonadota bacterium]